MGQRNGRFHTVVKTNDYIPGGGNLSLGKKHRTFEPQAELWHASLSVPFVLWQYSWLLLFGQMTDISSLVDFYTRLLTEAVLLPPIN